jgi:hypothetical protein
MKKIYFITAISAILILLIFVGNGLYAQSKAQVENVDFFVEGETLVINYDLEKAKTGELFNITVNIMTKAGKKISAFSFTGDVGKGIYGGKGKKIVWDLTKDNVYLDDEITVEVLAQSEMQAKPVSVGGAMLRSLVFPGWGNSYVKDGGAYWLMGVFGYAAAGGAVFFNNKSYNAFEDYKVSEDPVERGQLYTDAEDYQQKQKTLMVGAAAIWAVDLIWTGIQAGSANKKARSQKVSMGYYYNPVVRQPMFSVSYKF